MILFPIVVLFLVQSSLALSDDTYPESAGDVYNAYPEDLPDADDIEVHRRSNHYLRFGRSDGRYENDAGNYEDYDEYARPTRKTEKNDHFIRFGRGRQQEFLRFGRDPHRTTRDKSIYLRFGRSITDGEKSVKRSKREAFPDEKRSASFLRFGRNSNFIRFGRDPANSFAADANAHQSTDLLKLKQEPALVHFLAQLMAQRQSDKQCASAA